MPTIVPAGVTEVALKGKKQIVVRIGFNLKVFSCSSDTEAREAVNALQKLKKEGKGTTQKPYIIR